MNHDRRATAARMKAGESGVVVRIAGGHGLVRRLEALGIRPGKRITKVSSMFGRGPVTIRAGHTQVALGHGMADRIEVDLDSR